MNMSLDEKQTLLIADYRYGYNKHEKKGLIGYTPAGKGRCDVRPLDKGYLADTQKIT